MQFERYIERIPDAGCWLWTGKIFPNGYGCMRIQRGGVRTAFMAHRVVYQHYVGPIPAGCDLDHLCRVRSCVNPTHLEPVSRKENLRRGGVIESLRSMAAAKNVAPFCAKGHAMTPENTYIYPGGQHRACRECMRALNRKWAKCNRKSRPKIA